MSEFNTPLEALYSCRNHWSWLAITGANIKSDYEPSKDWSFHCACCEYMGHKGSGRNYYVKYVCNHCPLTSYAWSRLNNFEIMLCESPRTSSIYYEWSGENSQEFRIKYALQMVQACNRAIEGILLNSNEEGEE